MTEVSQTHLEPAWMKHSTRRLVQLVKLMDLLARVNVPQNPVRQDQFVQGAERRAVLRVLVRDLRPQRQDLATRLHVVDLETTGLSGHESCTQHVFVQVCILISGTNESVTLIQKDFCKMMQHLFDDEISQTIDFLCFMVKRSTAFNSYQLLIKN